MMNKTAAGKSKEPGIATNTLVRAFSAFAALPVILYGLMNGGVVFNVLICLIFGVAILEMVNIVRQSHLDYVAWLTLALALFTAFTFAYGTLALWLAVMVCGAGVIVLLDRMAGVALRQTLTMLGLALALGHIVGFSMVIRYQIGGILWWLLILIATWVTDTLAFAGGRAYGRTPLSLRWSPKKTLEGTITGVIGAVVVGVGSLAYYGLLYVQPLVVVAVAPLLAVIGDLLESRFKREYDVKDSSIRGFNVVPGHGGMLDRIDSLSAVVSVVFALLVVFGLIQFTVF